MDSPADGHPHLSPLGRLPLELPEGAAGRAGALKPMGRTAEPTERQPIQLEV